MRSRPRPAKDPSPPTRQAFEEAQRETAAAMARRRLWPTGFTATCPECGRHAFVGRDDLSHRIQRPGGILVFRHLTGARCQACGAQSLEPNDLIAIEDEAGVGITADYEAKVSRIGSGSLGTYWPKDVVRTLRLTPHRKAYIQVVDTDTALVRFGPTEVPAKRRRGRNKE